MSPKEKEEERRKQILDAAQKVFAQKGFEGASIKDLARAAKVSPGLLYWYFKDKADLFKALVLERIEEGIGGLPHTVSFGAPPEEFMRGFALYYISLFEKPLNTALFKIMVANAQTFPPSVREVRSTVINKVIGAVQGYFDGQVEAGRIRPCDTEMVTRTFMGSVVSYLLLKHVLQDDKARQIPPEKMVEGICDVVLRGILPGARPQPAKGK